jgi:glycosyltransferase involved in cell wall biosynthesis
MDPGAAWLLGDLAESTFADPAGLERAVDRAIDHPAWRKDLSEGIAARARAHFTSAAAAQRILDLIASTLGSPESPKLAPAPSQR